MKLNYLERRIKILRAFKASQDEWNSIQKKANKYTGGNVSEWIRYAAIHLDPRSIDIDDKKNKKS